MSEYIVTGEQLDALFAWIDELLPSDSKRPERASLYKRLEVPTFVRCRDCKWLDHHNLCLCMLPDGDGGYACWVVEPDGFCALGVRREG